MRSSALTGIFAFGLLLSPALSQEDWKTPETETIDFAGGQFVISVNENYEKFLTYDGQDIAHDFVLYYNRTVQINETDVALFEISPGGNACGPATILAWKPEGQTELKVTRAGDGCGSPYASINEAQINFVPYLLPGMSEPVQQWTPEDGLKIAGILTFTPQPDTRWADFDPSKIDHLMDLFANEDIYNGTLALLAEEIRDVTIGLSVSDGLHEVEPGLFYGYGCVPHNCGSQNSFIAVDEANKALYFAQQTESGGYNYWPKISDWPVKIKELKEQNI